MSDLIDVAVIGGGPAGTTAALYAARGKARTIIFASSDPTTLAPKHRMLASLCSRESLAE